MTLWGFYLGPLVRQSWRCFIGILLTVAGLGGVVCAQPVPGERHIQVSLVAESSTPATGDQTTLAVVMKPQPGWHGYWRNPGDAGLPPKLTWTLPDQFRAGDPAYPTPKPLLISGIMNHVYDKPYALLVPLTVPRSLAVGTSIPIKLAMSYLVCTEQVCVPEQATVAIALIAGDGKADPATSERFNSWRRALPVKAPARASYAISGGKFRIVVPLPAGLAAQNPHLFVDAQNVIDFAAPQSVSRTGDRLIFETKAVAAASAGQIAAVASLGNETGVDIVAIPGVVPPVGAPILATEQSAGASSAASQNSFSITLFAFLGAVLGGLVLNVMPCVFPILSLKALSLAKSNQDAASARREALAYAAGVILICVGLGGLILALRAVGDHVGWAFQLQTPGVIFGLILLMAAIGFNLAGLFELGAFGSGESLAAKPGTAGAFWTGALAAFVATPCTGPFMAAALGVALVLPLAAALFIFAGLGFGLALPFLAVGFIPAVRRALPKPGAWMNMFRHVLAIPMFLTAIGLAWVLGNQTGTNGIILALFAVLLIALGLWATGLRQRAMKERAWLPALCTALLAIACVAALPATAGAPNEVIAARKGIEKFDPRRLSALRASGKPVFLYLTADWCLTCKVNEKVAIERSETQAAFAKAGVVTMVGDWTNGDPNITRFLEQEKRSGVPVYLWYAPGAEARFLPQVLTTTLLAELANAGAQQKVEISDNKNI